MFPGNLECFSGDFHHQLHTEPEAEPEAEIG